MLISCSVVCYQNAPEQIARVLNSLASCPHSDSPELWVTLVDNSPDDGLAAVARNFGVAYIHLPENPGFGAGHNVAIQSAIERGAAYHLVLNPDTYFNSDVIPALTEFMQEHTDVGMIMPDIRYPDGSRQHLCKLLPTPLDLLMRRFAPGLYKSFGWIDRYELRMSGYEKIMDVPALSGCFMFIRTSVLGEVGGFDERFFMYLEDVDLSRRIGRVARTVYFPLVSITHEYVKGSYKNRKLLFHHIRSAVLYFNKWGWFLDKERSAVNQAALEQFQSIHAW
ncbi:glycosyltransferase family 2 protein [Noviherbaspirillum massiliense]|uniref:glycosyltransferase family 2 protein n=1 Tax=Noviherbaspirillum massiliense TaxID=1465823 RepID=UPI000474F7BD|nr:glycosyltransferase family 2 protein [Noviherbaspirillum massiliense]